MENIHIESEEGTIFIDQIGEDIASDEECRMTIVLGAEDVEEFVRKLREAHAKSVEWMQRPLGEK